MTVPSGVGELGRPSDGAMWTSVVATLREVVLPGLDDPHRRQVVIHLMGVAAYARDRGVNPNPARASELAAALDGLVRDGNELAQRHWREAAPADPRDVLSATSAVLVAAVDAGAAGGSAGDAVRAQAALRPILAQHLAEDLATEEVML
ncbi:MAG: hypothetical protein ACHQ02_09240, partial [Candidatus Limnocylindrales bacterium]